MSFKSDTYNYNATWNEVPAVYGIFNQRMELLYIGQTDNLKRRMMEHSNDKRHLMHKYGAAFVKADVIHDEIERCNAERVLINAHNPVCNKC
jgi:excinuclease UvrABC nuclease subunit